jgi:glycosyltransferase involved in cell wall biosynthesis
MRKPRPNVFSIERLYEDVRGAMPKDCSVTIWTCSNFSSGIWPRLQDMWRARKHQADVNHVTGDVHYLTFLLDPKRTVLTVHDLVMLQRLRGIRRHIFWLLWYWLPVRRSSVVVAISESTRKALLESVRCDPTKVRVIHNSVSDEFQPSVKTFDRTCPRILQIGTKPNKNLERVVQAIQGRRCRLVIVGALSTMQRETLRRYCVEYENHVGLTRKELAAQYAEADMLVFASTYEGFGLPVVEAQAVGRPVVASNLLSMPEVAGDGACLVDPFDVGSIRAAVQRIIEDEEYRKQLIQDGYHNVERFRASAVAERYAALYREVAVNARDNVV